MGDASKVCSWGIGLPPQEPSTAKTLLPKIGRHKALPPRVPCVPQQEAQVRERVSHT